MPGLSRLSATALIFGILLASAGAAFAGLGQPTPWQLGLQEAASPVMDDIIRFHNFVLWIITAITLFVLALLLIIIVRFNARANPTPSRTTHNTLLEVIWTIVPVVILVVIAVPSFRLLFVAARRAEAGPDREGDRQAVVLELRLSRQRQFRIRLADRRRKGPQARSAAAA